MEHQPIEYGKTYTLVVEDSKNAMRLDLFLSDRLGYTRSFFHRVISDGLVFVDDKKITKSGYKVHAGHTVRVTFPVQRSVSAQMVKQADVGITIIFEHPHFLIIDKPAHLLTHPTTSTSNEIALSDWLIHNVDKIAHVGAVDRPGIIHRLDKQTSGLMIIPRTNYAYAQFGKLFHDRAIQKIYYAVVQGHPSRRGTIDLSIGRHHIERNRMTTYKKNEIPKTKARTAVTHYEVERYFSDAALVRVSLETGRTHQIRVHFAAIGHPVVGDSVYGSSSRLIDRQALHAKELMFVFDDQPFHFISEFPQDMLALMQKLEPVQD